jgi:ABC-type branched-subunit amino acid transport system ATPase component/ABC-type branched-subunit amino acid transport system permease subunit
VRRLQAELRRPSVALGTVGLVLALAAPVLPGVRNSTLTILAGVCATAVAALGLDVLVGRTGQLSLAQASFVGVGAFATIQAGGRGAPWPLAIVCGIAATAVVATIAGLPSLRIRGLQIAIVTLAFQLAAQKFVYPDHRYTGADLTLDRPSLLATPARLFYFGLVCVAVVLLVRRRLGVTRAGRSLLAVRDIEARATAFGIEPGRTKLFAYTMAGALTGVAGVITAFKESPGSISDVEPFKLLQSLLLVSVVVVGGAESGGGIVLAALLLTGVPQIFTGLGRDAPLFSAALLVAAVVLQPKGLGGIVAQFDQRVRLRNRERPDPRPRLVRNDAAAAAAAHLRDVPRGLSLRVPSPALLEANHVTVKYGGVTALDDVSLEVRSGEVVGLIGANGAGKSTFFNAASGFAPTTGSIRFRGIELLKQPGSKRTPFGLARTFQDMGLVRAETVRENMLLAQGWLARYPMTAGILALGVTMSAERDLRRRGDLALELFGLDHLADERLGDLPYGTMRIAEIAAAVAAGPDLLLLDEATAGLGPEESQALGDRFLSLRDDLGLTLVVIEHHVPLIARVCDYCYCLESGGLIASGTPAEVTAEPRVVESFLGRSAAATGGGRK